MPSVAWIHCNYHENRLHKCLLQAENFLRVLNLENYSCLVCVNNNNSKVAKAEYPSWLFVNGSNSMGEFSAWQEGWRSINVDLQKIDILILTNDTYLYHQPFNIFSPVLSSSLRKVLSSNISHWSLGVVEKNPNVESLPKHLTSFFMVFDKYAVDIIMPDLTSPLSLWSLTNDYSIGKIFQSADFMYEKKMNSWLLCSSMNSWYAAEPLTKDSISRISMKAKCILLEHSLSKRLLDANIKMISCFDQSGGYFYKILYRLYFLKNKLISKAKFF
jgi:hypothetical protein